jgi:flagellar protein FlaG
MSDMKPTELNLVRNTRAMDVSPSPESRQSSPADAPVHRLPVEKTSVPVEKTSDHRGVVAIAAVSESQNRGEQQELKEAVTKLNDYVQSIQRDLTFEFDETSGKTVITVLDRNTKEVIRQIPDELALRLARDLQQDEPLSLFNMKV